MEPTLIDDGTLDTVISFKGKEYRFNFDPEMIDETLTGEQNYDAFVEWCKDETLNLADEEVAQ